MISDNKFRLDSQPESYFEELAQFRKINKRECTSQFPAAARAAASAYDTLSAPAPPGDHNKTAHPCQPAYRVDERLYPVLIASSLHSQHDPDECVEDPLKQLVRVSLPIQSQQAASKSGQSIPNRTHARNEDVSLSMSLKRHCVPGWASAHPSHAPSRPHAHITAHELQARSLRDGATLDEVIRMSQRQQKNAVA